VSPQAAGRLQRAFGQALRSRVAGRDAEDRGRVIWGRPGERWFSPADPIWRVHADAAMFAGGIGALVLQSLHPLAMAGVAGHSGYRGDPWGRVQRTAHYIAVTTYGTVDDAEAAIDAVRSVHERVRGKDAQGRPYRASDPHLLAWIHAAEIFAFMEAHRAFGPVPLSEADADAYVEQAGRSAALLGVERPPRTVRELSGTVLGYRDELELSPAAADTISFLLRTPPLPWVARPGYWMLAAGGIAVLPEWVRALAGLRVPTRMALGWGRLGTAAVRWGLDGVEDGRRSAAPAPEDDA
jgi:uncharacterized protein (DUF2236 family)